MPDSSDSDRSWDLPGDLDTITPFGNVAVLSVDDEAEEGVASVVMPWLAEPDSLPPEILRVRPEDGATGVPTTIRGGVGFNEFIDPGSVFAGSIQLHDADGAAVDGWGSGQETIASYAPKATLAPGTTYRITVVGITDLNGNALVEEFESTFTTAGSR